MSDAVSVERPADDVAVALPTILTPENAREAFMRFGGIDARPANEVKSGFKMGIYGPGGAGKTTLAATACDSEFGGPQLHLDARGNPHVVASRGSEVMSVPIDKFKDVEAVRKDIIKALNAGTFPFKSISLDNVSDMNSMDLRDRYGEMTKVDWTDHSATTADVLNVVRNFSDIADIYGIHVFFIFWESPEDRELRGQKINRSELALNRALQNQVPGIINWMGRLYVMDDNRFTRCLDFRPIEKQQISKWQVDPNDPRYAGLHMEVYNPHIGEILDSVYGGAPYDVSRHQNPLSAKR